MSHTTELPKGSDPEAYLQAAGRDRIYAEVKRHTAAEHLRHAVRNASKHGMSKTEIARLAGISRQTVHEMLR